MENSSEYCSQTPGSGDKTDFRLQPVAFSAARLAEKALTTLSWSPNSSRRGPGCLGFRETQVLGIPGSFLSPVSAQCGSRQEAGCKPGSLRPQQLVFKFRNLGGDGEELLLHHLSSPNASL